MVGWTIFCVILASTAVFLHEDVIRQILIGVVFAMVFLMMFALTASFSWSVIGGGIVSFLFSFKIYLNLSIRETERINKELEEELRRARGD